MKRKVISLLLAVCLMMALIPQTAFALADTESNNKFIEAQVFTPGEEITGEITEEDQDFYTFTLETSGRVQVDITAMMEVYSLQLFDKKAEEIKKWENNAWNEMLGYSQISHTWDLEAGTYVLRIMGTKYADQQYFNDSCTGTYTIQTAFADACADETEDNDSYAQANPLALDGEVNGQIALNDKYDYYKVELPQTGRLSLDVTSYMQYYSLYAFNADGEEIYRSKSNEWKETAGYVKNTHNLDFVPGTYYLYISGHGEYILSSIESTGTYNLKCNFLPAELTENEPNDRMEAANPLDLDGITKGQISLNDPEDYYKVQLPEAGRLEVDITARMEYHTLTLLDESGKKLNSPSYVEWNSEAGFANKIHKLDLEAGTYYLLVDGKGFLDHKYTGSYEMKTSFTSADVTEQEDNDTMATANLLAQDSAVWGQIALNDFYDFFKITMPEAGDLKITVVSYMEDYDLYIHDESSNVMWQDQWNTWDADTGMACYEYTVPLKAGTYLIKMSGNVFNNYISATGNYVLLLNHEHTWNEGVVTKLPVGMTPGEITYTCTVCGMTKTEVYTDECQHTWVDATCTEPKTCSNCFVSRGEALGHDYAGWQQNADNHWQECSRTNCPDKTGSIQNKGAHTYEDDQCSTCGYKKITYTMYVGGVGMADGAYLASGAAETTTTKPADNYAYYKDGTLTLHNFAVEGKGHKYNSASNTYAPIFAAGDLKLVLEGTNTITATDADKAIQPDGIVAGGALTVSGEGSAQITAEYAGIFAQNVTLKSGAVSIVAEDDGIYSKEAIIVESGELTVDAKDVGVFAKNADVQISGGKVTANAVKEGILTEKNLKISGGTVKAAGEFGIYAYGSISISGGNVTAEGVWKGIASQSTVNISGGEVVARCADTQKDNESWAIDFQGTFSYNSEFSAVASEKSDGSNAEKYNGEKHDAYDYIKVSAAKEEEPQQPSDGLWGDADRSGKVNAKDAMLVLQFYTKKITEDKLDKAKSDVDGNGKLNAKDAMLILQFYTKKIGKFPVEEQAQPKLQVTDAYSDVVSTEWGQYCYHIPQVSINGSTDLAANKAIYEDLYTILKDDVYIDAEYGPYVSEMVYTYGAKGTVLTVMAKIRSNESDYVSYRVYNISTETGALLTSEDLVKAYGMTMDDFYNTAEETLGKYWESSMNWGSGMEQMLEEMKAMTLAEENVKQSVPYINSKGELCVIANIYVPAGAGSYWYCLNTSGAQETINCTVHTN